jgi:hypothetical protein
LESTHVGLRNAAATRGQATPNNYRANVEEEVPTAEDERGGPTHAPYAAGNENRGDVAVDVDGFWKHGRRCIFDVRISKVLDKCEKLKKNKHLHACLEQRQDFSQLLYSVDGMSGQEVERPSKMMRGK